MDGSTQIKKQLSQQIEETQLKRSIYILKKFWLTNPVIKNISKEYKYDIGVAVRADLLDLDKCYTRAWFAKNLNIKAEYLENAMTNIVSIQDNIRILNDTDINVISNLLKAELDIKTEAIRSQLHLLLCSTYAKLDQSGTDASSAGDPL